jgi:hypothetical protein
VVSFTPRPFYFQGKSRWYQLDRRLGGPQSRSGCGGEEKNSQCLLNTVLVSRIQCLIKHHSMKHIGRVEVWLYAFLTLALDGDEWSVSLPDHPNHGKDHSTHCIEGWVRLRGGLDVVVKTVPFPAPAEN